jgi:hypothetical protein
MSDTYEVFILLAGERQRVVLREWTYGEEVETKAKMGIFGQGLLAEQWMRLALQSRDPTPYIRETKELAEKVNSQKADYPLQMVSLCIVEAPFPHDVEGLKKLPAHIVHELHDSVQAVVHRSIEKVALTQSLFAEILTKIPDEKLRREIDNELRQALEYSFMEGGLKKT